MRRDVLQAAGRYPLVISDILRLGTQVIPRYNLALYSRLHIASSWP
jgi:hypothetical protein